MPDIDLGPVGPPEGSGPDLVTFRPERPSWRDRPVPRSVVAVVSAVIAGAAVAAYLGPDPEQPDPGTDPVQLLVPETWLDVEPNPLFRPEVRGSDAHRASWEQAMAEHPPEAVLVLPLALYQLSWPRCRRAATWCRQAAS